MDAIPTEVTTYSPEETQAWAKELVQALPPGSILALHGDLGAGKTCLVQGLAHGLGIQQVVNSPTYTLINEYTAPQTTLYHIDLYRINGDAEALGLGLEEYLAHEGYTAIEWADRVEDLLPDDTVHIYLVAGQQPEVRNITIRQGVER
jgi:tRNA threonylcarbamoyladenosine biosynthesis protein TsaE